MSQEKLVTFQVVTNAENKPSIIGAEKWEILGTKALIKDCQLDSPEWDINRLFDHLYNNLCKLIMEQVHKPQNALTHQKMQVRLAAGAAAVGGSARASSAGQPTKKSQA